MLATAIRAFSIWRPVGDTAAITLRASDVFTVDTPLVGMPTTLSDTVGQIVHHPGPLEFWVIAVAQMLTGHRTAPMVAVVAVNLAAVVGIVVTAGWLAGRNGRLLAALMVGLCTWSLRGDYVIDPYNPYAAWLPLFAFAVALAATLRGHLWALPIALAAGSYAAQSHVSLLVPVSLTCLAALAFAVGGSAEGGLGAMAGRARAGLLEHRRPLGAAVAVALVCSAPVLIDMVAGRQNLWTLAGATGSDGPVLGLSRAWQVAARAVTSPPWLVANRSAFETVAPVPGWQQLVAALVLGLAVAIAVVMWRRHRAVVALVVIGATGMAGGTFAASRIPGGIFAAYALHNYLWLWPFTAVLWVGIICGVGLVTIEHRSVVDRVDGRAVRALPVALAVALLLVAVVGAVQPPVRASVLAGRHAPATGSLAEQLDRVIDDDATVVIDVESELDQSAVAFGLVLELERRGVDARVDDDLGGSFGSHRVVEAGVDAERLFVRVGRTGPPEIPDEAELVASYTPVEQRIATLEAASEAILDLIDEAGGLIVGFDGEVLDDEKAETMVRTGDLVGLERLDLVVQPEIPSDLFDRYADAQEGPILFVAVYR